MGAAGFRAALLALGCAACTSVLADARTFEGTHWHVTAVNGRSTPAAGDYRIAFHNGQMAGRFGCNGWGGAYAVSGQNIVASRVVSTLMGCPDPAATFESEGLAVLREPMRWALAGEKLSLSNSAGSIALERIS